MAQTQGYKDFMVDHTAFLTHYRAGDFVAAQAAMNRAAVHPVAAPYAAYYAVMQDRIEGYKKTPPERWDGVFTALSK